MNIVFRTGPSGLDARAAVVREIREDRTSTRRHRATPSGLAVVGVGLLDNLNANRVGLTYLAILFVFLFLSVRLRSVVRALLSLVPVLIAVGAASLIAYALSLKLSPITAVGGPLVVAACTEFTSLILLRFVEERRRGYSPRRGGQCDRVSHRPSVLRVGTDRDRRRRRDRDVVAALAARLRHRVGINVAIALLSALVVLPPMLVWAERRRWVTRGLVPEDVLDTVHGTEDAVPVGTT